MHCAQLSIRECSRPRSIRIQCTQRTINCKKVGQGQCNISMQYINAMHSASVLQCNSAVSKVKVLFGWGGSLPYPDDTQGTLLSQIITAADRSSSEREHNKQQRGRWIYQNDCWCSPLKTYWHRPIEADSLEKLWARATHVEQKPHRVFPG